MSPKRISRSPDLQRLWSEGFDIEIRSGHLLVKNVPYDTLRDFAPVSMMIEAQIIVAAHPSVTASNLRELIDQAFPGLGH